MENRYSLLDYSMPEHRFRFAGWCAATASSSSPNCRFTVETGLQILNLSGTSKLFVDWTSIPSCEQDFDQLHKKMCKQIMETSTLHKIKLSGKKAEFTYGIAAKLLSCYLKPIFMIGIDCPNDALIEKKRAYIHPPIDRVLLKNCKKEEPKAFNSIKNISWSTFSENQYFDVIWAIREFLNGEPLWKIEYCWDGYR